MKKLICRKKKGKNTQVETIGVLASARGIGGTHLSIMLANYLTAKRGKKVALVELDTTKGDFRKICDEYKSLKKNQETAFCFRLYEVDYYSNINKTFLGELYNYGYDYIIMDMGNNYKVNRDDLLRCTKKIIVGSMQEWKRKAFVDIVEKTSVGVSKWEWRYLLLYGSDKDIKLLRKKYKINAGQIPWEPDPFLIHSSNFDFFKELSDEK